jgi:hypothetical protein
LKIGRLFLGLPESGDFGWIGLRIKRFGLADEQRRMDKDGSL